MKCTERQILHVGPISILKVRFVVAVVDAGRGNIDDQCVVVA
jgi:hypothetical protein